MLPAHGLSCLQGGGKVPGHKWGIFKWPSGLQERRNVLTYEAIKSKETRWLRFGVVADQVGRPIGREDDLVYTPIGLFNRGRGIFHKEATQGRDLGDSTFFWVKPGDLVFRDLVITDIPRAWTRGLACGSGILPL